MKNKPFDVIVFGATSFVGQILCRYLLTEFGAPAAPGARDLRWAIAGRSRAKLDALVASLGEAAASLPVFVADAADADALRKLSADARVVVSTVGPYALFGETLVQACAEGGTDYCDLTGEAQWVKRMIDRHEAAAKRSGARIVHCCGFDSIPSDLGVWFLQGEAVKKFGASCVEVKMRVKAMRGAASGGTVASMLNIVQEARRDPALRKELVNPYSLCPPPAPTVRQANVRRATYDGDFGAWSAPFVMSAINVRMVLRSNALAGYPYGRDFRYDEAMLTGAGVKGHARAAGVTAALGAFIGAAALGPTRWLMEKTILPAPGEGPSPAAQAAGFYDFRFVGRTGDGRELRAKVTGDRDPGYGSTAKILGEAAACLARDVAKDAVAGGFWTPATAMGAALHARLAKHAGVTFEVVG